MRIEPAGHVAGLPALEARALMRAAARYDVVTVADLAAHLRRSPRRVARELRALAAAGFFERDPDVRSAWVVTTRGYALCHATAAKPLRRATAERIVAEVTARAAALADWDAHPFAFRVTALVLFGSTCHSAAERPTVNDVDLAIALGPRFPDPERQWRYMLDRTRAAWRAGRSFGSLGAELVWPVVEVQRWLRRGSHAVSLP